MFDVEGPITMLYEIVAILERIVGAAEGHELFEQTAGVGSGVEMVERRIPIIIASGQGSPRGQLKYWTDPSL